MVFQTKRLLVKEMTSQDKLFFSELLSKPEIINPIPQPVLSEEEILAKFDVLTVYEESPLDREKIVWGVYVAGQSEMIGIVGLLTNDEGNRELAYRYRIEFWGKGYASEIVEGLLKYCFTSLRLSAVSADVSINNVRSVRVLDKFLKPTREFYNERDCTMDRRYDLLLEDWKS